MWQSENYDVKLMESVAIIKVAIGVKRAEITGLYHDHDEPFKISVTRVCSKAETCNFTTVSDCDRLHGRSNKGCDDCWCGRR